MKEKVQKEGKLSNFPPCVFSLSWPCFYCKTQQYFQFRACLIFDKRTAIKSLLSFSELGQLNCLFLKGTEERFWEAIFKMQKQDFLNFPISTTLMRIRFEEIPSKYAKIVQQSKNLEVYMRNFTIPQNTLWDEATETA